MKTARANFCNSFLAEIKASYSIPTHPSLLSSSQAHPTRPKPPILPPLSRQFAY
ncbi:hypothetical protein [Rubritalea tangerina]|uniref:hypothetical protein n=1 Tax=Rubritalea tangerina TaxID=430798 RepID=UPI00360EE971